jgi:hypothetical protein
MALPLAARLPEPLERGVIVLLPHGSDLPNVGQPRTRIEKERHTGSSNVEAGQGGTEGRTGGWREEKVKPRRVC